MEREPLQLDIGVQQQLEKYCASEGRQLSDVVNKAVQQYVAKQSSKQGSSAKALYHPQTHLREAAIQVEKAALLFIDVQNFNCHPDGALYCGDASDPKYDYWWSRMKEASQAWTSLLSACRSAGIEVMYTVIESLTEDGRDRSLDYKVSGFHVPKGSFDAQVLDCISAAEDDIVIPKTSSSVFTTTNIDRLLRNMGKTQLILAGCLTDQCVESAVRDAADLNYLVTLATDGCCTYSEERHANSLSTIKGYCRQRTCSEIIAEIEV